MNRFDPVSRETLLWTLGSLCLAHRIPFDAKLVDQQFPPPLSLVTLSHAAQSFGFKIGEKALASKDELLLLHLPCVGILKNPEIVPSEFKTDAVTHATASVNDVELKPDAAAAIEIPPVKLAFIIKHIDGQLWYVEACSEEVKKINVDAFNEVFESTLLLFHPEVEAPKDDDARPKATEFGFKWFVPELLKHKPIWRDVLLISLVVQLMALATPVFTQVIIDKVIVHHTQNTLLVIGFALIMFMLFTTGLTWIRQYLVLHTGNRVDAVLGSNVFEHLIKLPMRYFEHRPTGTLITRVHGVETIREFVSGAAVTLLLDFPFLFIFLGIMFYYSWMLSLLAVVILGVIAGLSVIVTPLLRQRINQQFLMGARNQAFLTEYVSGMETVKSLQMEPQLKKRFGDYLADYLNASFNTRQLANTYNVVASMLEQILTIVVLCLGAWLVMTRNDFTIGMLVAFQMFASRLSGPMLRMVGLWQEFQQASIAVKRLGDIMNVPTEPYSLLPSRAPTNQGKIEIIDLSFRHREDLPYLFRNFSLTMEPGQCIAVMGASGSGKSTLAKLLQAFYLAQDGRILIDGRDIQHFSANELRQNFGVVPQDTMLFSGSIYENLIIANPHASFEQVVTACRMAEINDTIEKLPQGYQTIIGEHGVGLSGGEKQRLAIARALLKQPKILIFDEATSNLDQNTITHFVKTINRLKGKVSMLFITHQLPKELRVDQLHILGERDAEKHVSVVPGSGGPDINQGAG